MSCIFHVQQAQQASLEKGGVPCVNSVVNCPLLEDKFVYKTAVPRSIKELLATVSQAVRSKHNLPAWLPEIEVAVTTSSSYGASFVYDPQGNYPPQLRISRSPLMQVCNTDVLHEIGHYLDRYWLMHHPKFRDSLLSLLQGSRFCQFWKNPDYSRVVKIHHKSLDGNVKVLEQPLRDAIRHPGYRLYLLKPEELIASSYAQFIACGNPDLEQEISLSRLFMQNEVEYKSRTFILRAYPRQWDDEDFEEIAEQYRYFFARYSLPVQLTAISSSEA